MEIDETQQVNDRDQILLWEDAGPKMKHLSCLVSLLATIAFVHAKDAAIRPWPRIESELIPEYAFRLPIQNDYLILPTFSGQPTDQTGIFSKPYGEARLLMVIDGLIFDPMHTLYHFQSARVDSLLGDSA